MRHDLVIRGGAVIDGTGAPARKADVAVDGGHVAEIGALDERTGEREIDARGLVVAPGFIDVHTHDDRALLDGDMAAKASQGVTTVVAGNCGISLAPFRPDGRPPPPMDLLGGRGRLPLPHILRLSGGAGRPAAGRQRAVPDRPPDAARPACGRTSGAPRTKPRIASMRAGVEQAMQAGAVGFSTGLFYPPSRAAPTDEVVALAEAAAPWGGLYATHMRDEGAFLEESVEESLEIGRRGRRRRRALAPQGVRRRPSRQDRPLPAHGRGGCGRPAGVARRLSLRHEFDGPAARPPCGLRPCPDYLVGALSGRGGPGPFRHRGGARRFGRRDGAQGCCRPGRSISPCRRKTCSACSASRAP